MLTTAALGLVAWFSSPALAQLPSGSHYWQQQPYCNVVTLNVLWTGMGYTLDGWDDQCGTAQRAPVGAHVPGPLHHRPSGADIEARLRGHLAGAADTASGVRRTGRSGAGTAAAVLGTSKYGVAIAGASDSGIGVLGYGGLPAGVAVDGSATGYVAVRARAYGKTALEVKNGSIKVSGTTRPAFQHTTTAANTVGHATTLDHPMANGDPNAMLFVMHAYVPGATVNDPKEKSVWYDTALSKWRIYHDDLSSMPLGARFNVLVIKQ